MEAKTEVLVSPAGKKLKQTRLPFPIFSPESATKTPKPATTESGPKKRKLSVSGDRDKPSAKVKILENGEKLEKVDPSPEQPSVVTEISLLSDDEDENDDVKSKETNKSGGEDNENCKRKLGDAVDDEEAEVDDKIIKIKLPFGHKKAKAEPVKKTKKSKKADKSSSKANDSITISDSEEQAPSTAVPESKPDPEPSSSPSKNSPGPKASPSPTTSKTPEKLSKDDDEVIANEVKDDAIVLKDHKVEDPGDKTTTAVDEVQTIKETNEPPASIEPSTESNPPSIRSEASNDSTKTDPALTCTESMISTTQSTPSAASSPKSDTEKSQETKKVSDDKKKIEAKTPKSSKKLPEEEKERRQREREEKRRKEKEEKEMQRLKEKEAKEQQRLKEKQEKEEKLRREKQEKEERLRKEKEEKEEKLRKEKEEKEAAKRKEKEERERKKLAELEAKNEEKRKKEEEKRKKEEAELEEKRKQEEKKRKSAALFEKFFIKKPESTDPKPEDEENSKESTDAAENLRFMPFAVKENMRLAPPTRVTLSEDQKSALVSMLNCGADKQNLYLASIKADTYQKGKSVSTWPLDEDDDSQDIILVDPKGEEHKEELQGHKKARRYRAKFLKFTENRRPAYYGTWRKKSKAIGPRRPFGQDQVFDYEVDSDLEWEDEEPGESLSGSEDDKEKEEEDDYEVDNEFFVPHGHLSEEELENEDENPEDNSPEAQKARLKIMQQEFAAEMKKKTEKIKPRVIGCIWVKNNAQESDDCSPIVWEMLQARAMLTSDEPITLNLTDPVDEVVEVAPKKARIPDEAVPDLIRLVHGNPNSRKFLIDEFSAFRKKMYGDQENFCEYCFVGSKIKEIAEYRQVTEADGGMPKMSAWFVTDEFLEKFNMKDITLPNNWEYVLKPNKLTNVSPKTKSSASKSSTKKVWTVTEEAMPELIRLVHGNTHSRKFLIEEFTAYRKAKYGNDEDYHEFSFVGSRIKRIAVWKQCTEGLVDSPMYNKYCWLVNEEVLQKYNLTELPIPNTWTYTLEPPSKLKTNKLEIEASKENVAAEVKTVPSIEKFAVVLTEDDKKKQFERLSELKPITPTNSAHKVSQATNEQSQQTSGPPAKKRVQLLMSVPRGETIPEAKKNSLIEMFLNKSVDKPVNQPTPMDVDKDDVVLVD